MLKEWVEEVADLQLASGETVGDTFVGSKVLECALKHIEESEIPSLVPCNELIFRRQDMGPGRLEMIRQEDGDICMSIVGADGHSSNLEFCTYSGGGKSPRVLKALNALMVAIAADNKDRPLPE